MGNVIELSKIRKIDKKKPVPRYYQIYEILKEAIFLGRHKKGDRLPSERELSLYFGISRLTLRRALEKLENEGVIFREWGKGIFVNDVENFYSGKKYKIGLTLWHDSEISYHPVTLELLRGMWCFLNDKEFEIDLIFITEKIVKKREYKIFNEKDIKGLIISVGEIPDSDTEKIKEIFPETIFINRPHEKNSVNFDFKIATYKATKYLIEKRHKKIGFINGPDERISLKESKEGYIKALEEHGINFKKEFYRSGNYSFESGYNFTEELVKNGVDSLICGDNVMVIGVFTKLKKMGIKCPYDISLISFNDFPFADHTEPPLTTIKVPFFEIGVKAVENLIDLIYGKEIDKEVFEGEIIERKSVKERR